MFFYFRYHTLYSSFIPKTFKVVSAFIFALLWWWFNPNFTCTLSAFDYFQDSKSLTDAVFYKIHLWYFKTTMLCSVRGLVPAVSGSWPERGLHESNSDVEHWACLWGTTRHGQTLCKAAQRNGSPSTHWSPERLKRILLYWRWSHTLLFVHVDEYDGQ